MFQINQRECSAVKQTNRQFVDIDCWRRNGAAVLFDESKQRRVYQVLSLHEMLFTAAKKQVWRTG